MGKNTLPGCVLHCLSSQSHSLDPIIWNICSNLHLAQTIHLSQGLHCAHNPAIEHHFVCGNSFSHVRVLAAAMKKLHVEPFNVRQRQGTCGGFLAENVRAQVEGF